MTKDDTIFNLEHANSLLRDKVDELQTEILRITGQNNELARHVLRLGIGTDPRIFLVIFIFLVLGRLAIWWLGSEVEYVPANILFGATGILMLGLWIHYESRRSRWLAIPKITVMLVGIVFAASLFADGIPLRAAFTLSITSLAVAMPILEWLIDGLLEFVSDPIGVVKNHFGKEAKAK
jgi:hypothetical protein